MRRWIGLVLAAAGFGAAMPEAVACGTVQDWTARYQQASATDASRLASLAELAQYCGDYVGAESDALLLPVLADAVTRGYPAAQLQRVWETYRCLPGAEGKPEHAAVAAALPGSKCPSAAERAAWLVVAVDGATLRAGPKRSAQRVASLRANAILDRLGSANDWEQVRTWSGVEGYVYAPLVKPY